MFTLGVNAAFHDPAAALVHDGVVVAAAEEERFTKIKHGKRPVPFSTWELPFHAIDFCLRHAGIRLVDVDHVAYSFDPSLLPGATLGGPAITIPLDLSAYLEQGLGGEWLAPWDPLFLTSIVNAPGQLADGAPHHLKERFAGVTRSGPYRWHFVAHHLAHAASAFLPSPFASAAVMSLDGRGERATTTYWRGAGSELWSLGDVEMPHSLGLLYESVTDYLGFLRSSDEYKVMALASYGTPRYADEFREMIVVGDGGRYEIAPVELPRRFGPPRLRGGAIGEHYLDIARSLQLVLEERVIALARWLRDASGERALCLAGGVALNCVMNARLRDTHIFDDIWVQPAAGDAGTALGAAMWIDARERGDATDARERGEGTAARQRGDATAAREHSPPADRPWRMEHAFLGPDFTDDEIEEFLKWTRVPYRRLDDRDEAVAALLAQDRVIGWFQGRMEFGPRALGARSIIASPINASMQQRLNDIKDREDFRPVAPVVLEEEAGEWFEGASVAPYMLFVFNVRPDRAARIPAVRHVDGTARVQTIRREQNASYYDLLAAFHRRTGVPVLINTSFNTRGEPIVCSPRDAVESFWTSPLDALVIGPFLLEKRVGDVPDDTAAARHADEAITVS